MVMRLYGHLRSIRLSKSKPVRTPKRRRTPPGGRRSQRLLKSLLLTISTCKSRLIRWSLKVYSQLATSSALARQAVFSLASYHRIRKTTFQWYPRRYKSKNRYWARVVPIDKIKSNSIEALIVYLSSPIQLPRSTTQRFSSKTRQDRSEKIKIIQ